MKICVVIPSYNPDEKLLKVVMSLKENDFHRIIIVDDGSADKSRFDELPDECVILRHYKNLGKGRALKTAFNYYLNNFSDECDGVVTIDGDNQHHVTDVEKCVKMLGETPDCLILGCRNFNGEDVPRRSRYGNKITSFMFRALCGLNISDTQTGLRAMSNKLVEKFMDVKGERFEYETNMLLETKRFAIKISEVEIRTIYIDENRTSHFNPISDSFAIYKIIFGFVWASLASTLLDLGLFVILVHLLSGFNEELKILISTCTARIISSFFNYTVNKNLVFKGIYSKYVMLKYYILCAFQLAACYFGVLGLSLVFGSGDAALFWIKVFVDTTLFLVSFQIQRELVFKTKQE